MAVPPAGHDGVRRRAAKTAFRWGFGSRTSPLRFGVVRRTQFGGSFMTGVAGDGCAAARRHQGGRNCSDEQFPRRREGERGGV